MTQLKDLKLWKQQAIYLHEVENLNGTEIALELNIPQRTVYDNIKRWKGYFRMEDILYVNTDFVNNRADTVEGLNTHNSKANILFLDIEKTFSISGHFPQWDTNLSQQAKFREGHILSYCYAINDGEVFGNIIPAKDLAEDVILSFMDKNINTQLDKSLIEELWVLLDDCDVLVAYNGKGYDVKEIQAGFLKYNLPPPSPFKIVDPMLIAKKKFRLPFKSMKYLADYLQVTQKIENIGMALWKNVMLGDEEAVQEMLEYNKGDVVTLRDVYYKLRAWGNDGVNLALYDDEHDMLCPHCGSDNIEPLAKLAYAVSRKYHAYRCQSCLAVMRSNITPEEFTQKKLYRIV